jgi:cell wall-associated NlpC family hydrolase
MKKCGSALGVFAVVLWLTAGYAQADTAYVVQAGDTLEYIAEQAGLTVEEFMDINALSDGALYIGQVLNIENSGSPVQVSLPVSTPVQAPAAPTTYTVQPGENMTDIAARFGFTLPQLLSLNNLSNDVVDAGTVLLVYDRLNSQVSRQGNVAEVRRLLVYADQFIGTPYRYGGSAPGGFDCSGFTSYVFHSANINLPRTAASQYSVGTSVTKAELQPGDLVFFAGGRSIDHVGIYVGNGRFIHSSSPSSGGVIYSPLEDGNYYSRTYVGARRVF